MVTIQKTNTVTVWYDDTSVEHGYVVDLAAPMSYPPAHSTDVYDDYQAAMDRAQALAHRHHADIIDEIGDE